MRIEGGTETLLNLVTKQLSLFFILEENERKIIEQILSDVLLRVENNFSKSKNKYYRKENEIYFNPYHSVQYCIFLYYLSNSIYRLLGVNALSDKIYYLNKALNACDIYYEIQLPDFFTTDHPVGTVLGRAQYGEGFGFAQNCTVGNYRGIFPKIGQNVKLTANSIIIGNCTIGDNVTLGAGALVKNQDIPDNSLVFGQSPNLIIKPKKS